ncbi:Hypothetical predicted protein [Pelobates cultripes]|uniref:Uncharacterized protein n=1 Tax=Pelobates cultripes TaxID=61616 RepID=A0AAD1RU90_PELCU|nr:Hypothetical predicted protein [Pelobates cultripes]
MRFTKMADAHPEPKLNEQPNEQVTHTSLEQRMDELFARFWTQLEPQAEATQARSWRRPRGGKEQVTQVHPQGTHTQKATNTSRQSPPEPSASATTTDNPPPQVMRIHLGPLPHPTLGRLGL